MLIDHIINIIIVPKFTKIGWLQLLRYNIIKRVHRNRSTLFATVISHLEALQYKFQMTIEFCSKILISRDT